MALLQLERISAQYPGAAEPVLADISLSLGPQQLLVALGPSGSGKTSLLNLIAGFVPASAGRISLDGVPVQGPSAERGVVFQDDALLPWQNVLGNVAFGRIHRELRVDQVHHCTAAVANNLERPHRWALDKILMQMNRKAALLTAKMHQRSSRIFDVDFQIAQLAADAEDVLG